MKENLKVSIVILAAGASTRMGKPKQLLPWNDSNLLNHAVKTARYSKATDVTIVLGANFKEISNTILDNEVNILHNKYWANGMGTSIALAVDHLNTKKNIDAILIMLVDQPFLTSNDLNMLINKFLKHRTIVATTNIKMKLGVPAVFSKLFFKELVKLDKDEGAKSILKKKKDIVKTVHLDNSTVDIDTEEEYNTFYN